MPRAWATPSKLAMPLSTVTSNCGCLSKRQVDDRRRQPVAVHRAVGHHVVQRAGRGAEQRQAAQRHGAGGGAVAVVVGDDADALPRGDRVGQQPRRGVAALQRGRRQQLRQRVVELVGARHAARGEQARQQRVHAGLLERERDARRHVAGSISGGVSRSSSLRAAAHSASSTVRASAARCDSAADALPPAAPARCELDAAALAAQRQAPRLAALGRGQQGRDRPARRARARLAHQAATSASQRGAAQSIVDLHAGGRSALAPRRSRSARTSSRPGGRLPRARR